MDEEDKKLVMQLSAEDKSALSLSIVNRKVSLLQAEKALAQHELAEMNYKYYIMQLYMKYGLTSEDSFNESGEILRNSNVQDK
jgi:hypothetical protein